MPVYDIAGLKVFMEPKGETLLKQSKKYLDTGGTLPKDCSIKIDVNSDEFKDWMKKFGHTTYASSEYHWCGYDFFRQIQRYDGFFFHASAVALDNRAYLFSAQKGTGKSTHTRQWVKYFGNDRAVIINDDKPVVRLLDDEFFVCGNPFSGKEDISADMMVPLKGICFLQRAENNSIQRIKPAQALPLFFSQTLLEKDPEFMDKLLTLCDKLMEKIPIYILECNISAQAVETAYKGMNTEP